MDLNSIDIAGLSPQRRRLLALDRANRVRTVRAGLKRQLRDGEITPADAIVGGSSEIATMTVAELLTGQRGWGPKRASKVLRSVLLSERKTLGSLTERQRADLVGVLSGGEKRNTATTL